MENYTIEDAVHDYVATHEIIITNKAHKRDENLTVKFTRWEIVLLESV